MTATVISVTLMTATDIIGRLPCECLSPARPDSSDQPLFLSSSRRSRVLGLARSDASARAVEGAGAQVHRGDLDNLESLRAGAESADGVIHLAFNHDFTDYTGAAETDRRAIDTLGEVLIGSDRPFVVTSGLAGFALGRTMTEDDAADPDSPRGSEQAALAFTSRGVRVSVLRLPHPYTERVITASCHV